MKLQLKQLQPNPFKKLINGGKLNQEQVKTIRSNLKELGLMGSIPVVEIKSKYHLVSHHHRVEALRQEFGNNYEVEVVVHKYDDEKMFRGMVIENVTQRVGEFREEMANVVAVREALTKNPQWLNGVKILTPLKPDKDGINRGNRKQSVSQGVGSRQISDWLNKQGEVMSHMKINDLLKIHDNLSKPLLAEVEKTHKGKEEGRRNGGVLSFTQATMLTSIEDKKEQEDLAKALKNSQEQRVREQTKLITKYKEATDAVKENIRTGETNLADIDAEIWQDYKEQVKNRVIGKELAEEIENMPDPRADLDELLDEGDSFERDWVFFEKNKLQFCTKEDKERFEMNRKAYIKAFGGRL